MRKDCYYYDKGVSATNKTIAQRPRLQDMLNDMEKNLFKAVLVYNADRLARKPLEHQIIRQHAKEHNVHIILSSPELPYDTGEVVPQLVKDGLTKFEADTTRDRTRDTFKYKTQIGELIGGHLPFGYKRSKNGSVEQDGFKIEIVKEIFQLYKRGLGFNSIAKQITNQNLDKNIQVKKDLIKRIITNPFYAGYTTMNRINKRDHNSVNDRSEWIMGKSELIPIAIEKKDWEYCFKLYEQRKRRRVPPKHYQTDFLLKDLIYCKECQKRLRTKNQVTKSKHGKEYGSKIYYCENHNIKCGVRFKVDDIHPVVNFVIEDLVLARHNMGEDNYLFKAVVRSLEGDVKLIDNEIRDLRGKLSSYTEDISRAKGEVQTILREDRNKREKDLLEALTMYQFELKKQIKEAEKLIQAKIENAEYIKIALKNYSLWDELYKDFIKKDKQATRRAFIHLISRIEVNKQPTNTQSTMIYKNSYRDTFKDNEFRLDVALKTDINLNLEPNLGVKEEISPTYLNTAKDKEFLKKIEQEIDRVISSHKGRTDLKEMKFNLKIIED